jgi:hypothetical protein
MRVALVLPPLSQLNTPYPSISYLARHLRKNSISCTQRDLGIEVFLQLFSRTGLTAFFDRLEILSEQTELPEPAWRALSLRARHEAWIEALIPFLQGQDRTLAARIIGGEGLPSGPRLERADPHAFGPMSSDDMARHLGTLYLADLVDLVRETIEPGLGLGHYHHHLAMGAVQWPPLAHRLGQQSLIDSWLDGLTDSIIETAPDLLGLSVPFPGMLYGALRIGQRARQSGIPVLMGGGYVSTELREVHEPGIWDCIDGLIYDDGEDPLMAWIEHQQGGVDQRHRTRTADGLLSMTASKGFTSAAWYGDLNLSHYLQVVDSTNPAHRLWSDGRWNKITLAHGCYWRRCAFCDIQLDYIARYEPSHIPELVNQIEELVKTTGIRGFHLVDEAAPPRLLRDLSIELLRRNVHITWWGNIRFEKAFTPDLCRLMAAAGAVALTGGLEVASDRLLKLMDKGITVEQAARACQNFQDAGILIHAYLMYGFPSQTLQESVDAMEIVRQLFSEGMLDSAFWHRFVLTRHSDVFAHPSRFGVEFSPPEKALATNDIPHRDPSGCDPDVLDVPLERSLSAWMAGRDVDRPVHDWLPPGAPVTSERPDRIRRVRDETLADLAPDRRLLWLGGHVLEADHGLVLHHSAGETLLPGSPDLLQWASEIIEASLPAAIDPTTEPLTVRDALAACPADESTRRRIWKVLRRTGLVGV